MRDSVAAQTIERSPVQSSLIAAGFFGLALLLLFHTTTWSMVSIWLRSETFAHGFLILPISLWLIWNERERLRQISPMPALWVAVLMIPPGFVWLLAWLVDVLVIQQLAMVAMLLIGAWTILGHQLTRAMAFPLLFLFLAVPMGEALVPPMMEFTATSTVWMIQQTGIPVYREGLYFTLPSGNWSVVEACSGVRYIIASITLGVLYAYLTYRSLWRRLVFIVVSAIVPVFANSIRAYIIVMLGHMSDMAIATGVDHLIYGWVFFGLVVFLLFWVGAFFREDRAAGPAAGLKMDPGEAPVAAPALNLLAATALALAFSGIWSVLAFSAQSGAGTPIHKVTPPVARGAWRDVSESPWQWQPETAVKGQVGSFYERDGQAVALYVQYPEGGTTSGEVVGSSTSFVAGDSGLRVLSQSRVNVRLADETVTVDQAKLRRGVEQILVWSWYRIGNLYTSNDYLAKLYEARSSLGLGPAGTYRVVLAAPVQEDISSTGTSMQEFLDEHGRDLDHTLAAVARDVL